MIKNFKYILFALATLVSSETMLADNPVNMSIMTVSFEKGKSELSENQKSKFSDILIFKDSIIIFEINGYPDSTGMCKKRLAKKRASAVKDYLLAHGVDKSRINITWCHKDCVKENTGLAVIRFSYKTIFKVESQH